MKKSINPTRIPIEQKESYRWLENVRQSTTLLEEPSTVCTSETGTSGTALQTIRILNHDLPPGL
jgi:hypothetical protein